jgi:probable HAF family extracellular repeat protein
VKRPQMGLLAAVAFGLAAVAASAQLPARDWTIVDLGSLGGTMTNATAMSDNGHIVGCSERAGGGLHAFIYRDGVMSDLDPNGAPGVTSCAFAVNNSGVVAGRIGEEIVVWSGGVATRLGVEGWPEGINEAGIVVGSLKFGTSVRAFMWNRGAIVNLGTLGGSDSDPYTRSEATAINERNQVVGTSNGRAFLYENGAMRDLGSGRANAINDRGEIVGMTSSNGPMPFIHTGVMTLLPGPGYSGAIDINNQGQVIGSGEGNFGYIIQGNGYVRLETMPSIAAQGWYHLEPAAINSRGWITGIGMGGKGTRAFLMIPGARKMAVAREVAAPASIPKNPAAR